MHIVLVGHPHRKERIMIKQSDAMKPIILIGREAIEAAEEAINRSLKNGIAAQALKNAREKPPILKRKLKS